MYVVCQKTLTHWIFPATFAQQGLEQKVAQHCYFFGILPTGSEIILFGIFLPCIFASVAQHVWLSQSVDDHMLCWGTCLDKHGQENTTGQTKRQKILKILSSGIHQSLSVTFSPVHRPSTAELHACCTRRYVVQLRCRRRRSDITSSSCSHSSSGRQWDPLLTSHTPSQKHKLSSKIYQHWKHRCVHVCVFQGGKLIEIFFD